MSENICYCQKYRPPTVLALMCIAFHVPIKFQLSWLAKNVKNSRIDCHFFDKMYSWLATCQRENVLFYHVINETLKLLQVELMPIEYCQSKDLSCMMYVYRVAQ